MKRKPQNRRSMAQRLAWGGPFWAIGLALVLLGLFPPWRSRADRLAEEGIVVKAQIMKQVIKTGKRDHRPLLDYAFRLGGTDRIVRGRDSIDPTQRDLVAEIEETGMVFVAYLPEDPEINCMVSNLGERGRQSAALPVILIVGGVLIGGFGVAAAVLDKQQLLDALERG